MPDDKQSKTDQFKQDVKREVEKIPSTSDQNLLAALSYVWLLSVVMLLIKRHDEFVQFHAKQGVVLVLLTIFWWIPVLGQLLWALAVVGMVIGFINAWQGKRFQLPFVYSWSQKIKL